MTSSPGRRWSRGVSCALPVLLTLLVSSCASTGALRSGERAERERDYDQAVVIYTRALQERPRDRNLQLALERARLRAAQMHYAEGRRLEREALWADALAEYRIAYDLNPGMADIEGALRGAQEAMRAELAAAPGGRTALEALIDSTFDAAPPGLDLPRDITLPDSVVFSSESARAVFAALGQLTGFSIVFDAQFRDAPFSGDLRDMSFDTALAVVAAGTGNFFRVTAPGTVTVIPDTPAKRREYEEEIIRTFYLSNADLAETIDLLRLVVDLRRLAPVTATNAISIKDTPERIDAAAQLIRAIDKARAEVVIEVQLLEVDRQVLRDYGPPVPLDRRQFGNRRRRIGHQGHRHGQPRHRSGALRRRPAPRQRLEPVRRQSVQPAAAPAPDEREHADTGQPATQNVGRRRRRGPLR